jgi:hypothetical protein
VQFPGKADIIHFSFWQKVSTMAEKITHQRKHSKKTALSVGARGKIRFGQSKVGVEIVEDRGPVGTAGRRLVRVRYLTSPAEPDSTFEVPADEVVLSRRNQRQKPARSI